MTPFTGERPITALLSTHDRGRPRVRWTLAAAAAFAIHLPLWIWSSIVEPTIESWSAELAARVHAELSREDIVELVVPPPRLPPPAPPPIAEPVDAPPPTPSADPTPPAPRPRTAAASAALTASEAAPVDLTGDTLVTGTATAPSGGATTSGGTSAPPAPPPPPATTPASRPTPPTKPPAIDRARPVALSAAEWECPWPSEATASPILEQAVVIRVTVGADGRAERARATTDPGHGFAAAAVACALRTRFQPALDPAGRPIRAESPPIRVVFSR